MYDCLSQAIRHVMVSFDCSHHLCLCDFVWSYELIWSANSEQMKFRSNVLGIKVEFNFDYLESMPISEFQIGKTIRWVSRFKNNIVMASQIGTKTFQSGFLMLVRYKMEVDFGVKN